MQKMEFGEVVVALVILAVVGGSILVAFEWLVQMARQAPLLMFILVGGGAMWVANKFERQ